MSENTLEKIRKLLRLGGSSNQHEAELAMAKARELALQNELDISQISTQDNKATPNEPIIKDGTIRLGQRKSIVEHYCGWIINKHFNCKVVYSGSRFHGYTLYLIGRTSDTIFAQYVHKYLSDTFMNLWYQYKSQTNADTYARSAFLNGVYNGLNSKLIETARAFVETKKEEVKTSLGDVNAFANKYSLMVVSNKEALEKATKQFFPKLKTGQAHRINYNPNAMAAGIEAGRGININRPISSGNQTQIRG